LNDLMSQGYGAVLLALGAHRGQKPNIPGAQLEGTLVGTSFMKAVNLGQEVRIGKKVLVVGGGNVAMDCARSALRLGAEEVHIACLEGGKDEMAAEKSDIEQAEEEGVRIHTGLSLNQIREVGGKVSGVDCVEVANLKFDPDGRPYFDELPGTERTLSADTIIFAIGQTPDLSGLPADSGIESSPRGTLSADPEVMMTGRRGVFAAGDCHSGPTSIIEAINSGQNAAFYLNRFLQGDVLRVRPQKLIQEADIIVDIPTEIVKHPRQSMPMLPVLDRVSNFKEVALGFEEEAAMTEAGRCLNCAGHLCKDVCPYSAPQFAVEEKAKMQKCDLCFDRWGEGKKPICVEACPPRALDAGFLEELEMKYGKRKDAVGFVYSPVVRPSIVNKPKKNPNRQELI
jgi:NADPH-dependent glutamate synthase beta subunit-like oxidoreductase